MVKRHIRKVKKPRLEIACSHFAGDKPCAFHKSCGGSSCKDFKAFGRRALVIKFAAMGDVLRTTPILAALKKDGFHITWLAAPESREILEGNPHIDRIYTAGYADTLKTAAERFDLILSLDKNPAAAAIASLVKAGEKRGFGLDRNGNLCVFEVSSSYAFELGFDDELKFRKNRRTYQDIVFEMCGLRLPYGEYVLASDKRCADHAKALFKRWGLGDSKRIVGLNTGAGRVFATKKWGKDLFVRLAGLIESKLKARVLLLGGPEEVETNRYIAARAGKACVNAGNDHSVRQFAEIVGRCGVVVTSDTLAMHLAIARKVPVVALFGSTTPHEVDLYGRGVKIYAGVACSPCYRSSCGDMKCMAAITPGNVLEECAKLLR